MPINLCLYNRLESTIDEIERLVGNPHSFLIPGSTETSAYLDYARSLSRRAERRVLDVHAIEYVSSHALIYLNRLSSLLYALARYVARVEMAKELSPSY
jgi:cob(I)alamin adenosyltransferase